MLNQFRVSTFSIYMIYFKFTGTLFVNVKWSVKV